MQMLTVAGKLDWSGWLKGIVGAFVSGGAGAIGAGVGAVSMDPSHDLAGLRLLGLIGIAFLTSGIISLAKFLQLHPVPDGATNSPQP